RRSDRQQRADRLDPVNLAVGIDEGHHHFARRSSSAWAKYADAFLRISFARFSSRTSRSSSFSRWRSSVVRPARWPVSRSAWRTHRRSVSAVHPSLLAIDAIAAHWGGRHRARAPSGRRARVPRENIDSVVPWAPSSTNEPSDNP